MSSLHHFISSLDLRKISHMLALAEHGSFCKAADSVNITQPALSRSIQSLEDMLGERLFDRSSRNVQLTPAGQLSVAAAREMLLKAAEFYHLVGHADATKTGELTVGLANVAAVYFGPLLLRGFAEHFSQLRLILEVGTPEVLYEMLRTEKLDVVVGNSESMPTYSGFAVEMIGMFKRGFFVRANHPLCANEVLTTEQLVKYPIGTTYPLPNILMKSIKHTYRLNSPDSFFRIRSNHYGALVDLMLSEDAVVFGASIAYLQQLRCGQVILLNVTPHFPTDMPLTITAIAGRAISPAAALVTSIIRENIAAEVGASKVCGEGI